ncbi:MAG: FAD-binding protein [Paracoccaceae bacterium]
MTGKPHKVRMDRISIALADLPTQAFDVVIVGSGYGGSIAASRLAGAGKRVCLLERGREILPPDYPTDLAGAQAELQVVTARKGRLKPDANGMMECAWVRTSTSSSATGSAAARW